MAGLVTWRAGQLGSGAAFDDRQAVSQTIQQSEQDTEVALAAIADARAYVRYVTDYAEAGALDDTAAELDELGAPEFSQVTATQADDLRLSATVRAAATDVFGRQTVYAQLAAPTATPRSFDFIDQITQLQAEARLSISSPGELAPDEWAADADETRVRVRGLRLGAFFLMVGVVAFTIAQVTDRGLVRLAASGGGLALFIGTMVVTFTTVF